jgi:hypothetical protein
VSVHLKRMDRDDMRTKAGASCNGSDVEKYICHARWPVKRQVQMYW